MAGEGLDGAQPVTWHDRALAAAIDLYRAMDMTFWLPQAEAALAQLVG